ncbi:REP-associated tyrosine transposase [Blastopirellula marina]|uniref:Transposase n=1 Tax=Blastopirellula marina TaxID=124 RepID=A0A2S8GQE7_9BACT|nr:transposase [Blastopirellula marina]PQO46647.1 transposase [Blastopirellula marina]
MSKYRRSRIGSVFFFTVVTYQRRPILTTSLGRYCLREAFRETRSVHPLQVDAIVILPDHLHAIWTLPDNDNDYSLRWRKIKASFTKQWRKSGGLAETCNPSRIDKGEHGVWQRRFYEHTCRDEDDVRRCIDYVHVNPLKHGLVDRVCDWPWSTFHRYVRQGVYGRSWGNANVWYGDEFRDFE